MRHPAEPATGGRAPIVSLADNTIRAGRMHAPLHRTPSLTPRGGVGRLTAPGATGLAEGTPVMVGGGGLGRAPTAPGASN